MTTRVAFLRAVNVGKRTVRMARLVELFEQLGYDNVWTYINSGNVVFDASGSRTDAERSIEDALDAEFGFEVTTYVRTATELTRVLQVEPFDVAATDTYFVTFLNAIPAAATSRAFESLSNDFDTLVVRGREFHWRMRGKSTESTLKKKDWLVFGAHGGTSRNVTMLRRLANKLEG